MKPATPHGWLVCDKNICIYDERNRAWGERCIKHGAILTYRHRISNAPTRAAAKSMLRELGEL